MTPEQAVQFWRPDRPMTKDEMVEMVHQGLRDLGPPHEREGKAYLEKVRKAFEDGRFLWFHWKYESKDVIALTFKIRPEKEKPSRCPHCGETHD